MFSAYRLDLDHVAKPGRALPPGMGGITGTEGQEEIRQSAANHGGANEIAFRVAWKGEKT